MTGKFISPKKTFINDINNNWDETSDEILNRWRKHCQSMAWMHEKSAEKYKFLQKLIEVPGFLLGAMATGSFITFVIDTDHAQQLANISFVGLNILSNLLALLQILFGLHSKYHNHDKSGKMFRRLERKMQQEHDLAWSVRKDRNTQFEKFNRQYHRILEESEPISKKIRKSFYVRKLKKEKEDEFFDHYILTEEKRDGMEDLEILDKLKEILRFSDSSSSGNKSSSKENSKDTPNPSPLSTPPSPFLMEENVPPTTSSSSSLSCSNDTQQGESQEEIREHPSLANSSDIV